MPMKTFTDSHTGERHKGPNLWFWETKQNLRRRLAPSTPLPKVLGQKSLQTGGTKKRFLVTFSAQVCLLMDHKENQSPAQERKHNQLAELIRVTWGFAKDFSVNEVSNRHGFQEHVTRSRVTSNILHFEIGAN